jgi:hypothetical protein
MEMTTSPDCPEGLEDSIYYDLYMNVSNGPQSTDSESSGIEEESSWIVKLIAEWTRCDADGYGLGYHNTAEACA